MIALVGEPLVAYLDAGTGSVILQAILGGTAAIAVTMKFYGRRILHVLHIKRQDPEPVSPADDRE